MNSCVSPRVINYTQQPYGTEPVYMNKCRDGLTCGNVYIEYYLNSEIFTSIIGSTQFNVPINLMFMEIAPATKVTLYSTTGQPLEYYNGNTSCFLYDMTWFPNQIIKIECQRVNIEGFGMGGCSSCSNSWVWIIVLIFVLILFFVFC